MQTYIASLLRHAFTALAGLGGLMLSHNLITQSDVSQVDAAGSSLACAITVVVTAVIGRVLLTLGGKMFTGGAGESSGTSGGALLLAIGTAAGIMGCLPSCSMSGASAAWAALKSIPIHTTVVTDYGAASYSSKSGLSVEVDAYSGK